MLIDDVISVVKHTASSATSTPRHAASLAQSQQALDNASPSINSVGSISSINVHAEDYTTITINFAKRLIDQQISADDGTSVGGTSSGIGSNADVNKWRIQSVTLVNNDKLIVREWFETLTKILDGESILNCLVLFCVVCLCIRLK